MNLGSVYLANYAPPVERFALREAEGEEAPRIINGVASSEIVDRSGTIVDFKSLKKASKAFMKRRTRPMYWNHGWWMPIGRVLGMDFDDDRKLTNFTGLIGRDFPVPVAAGTMRFSTQKYNVDELWTVIQQDLAPGDSIAFTADVEEGEKDKDTGRRGPDRLHVTDLLEISVVTIPANSDAEFSVGRALDDALFVAMIEEGLRSRLFNLDERRMELTVANNTIETSGSTTWTLGEVDGEGAGDSEDWSPILEEVRQCRTSLQTRS